MNAEFTIRNITTADIKDVYRLLSANRPYVGLNSRYTYFLLAKHFQQTCLVAQHRGKIVAFASGYTPPTCIDTFFCWEIVVDEAFRGKGLQKLLLLKQLELTGATYLEATVNPSNSACKNGFLSIAKMLNTSHQESVLFKEEDFENDGHEAELLIRIGPIPK